MNEFSPREREVSELIAAGFRPSEIASRLKLSVKTVAVHKHNIKIKTGHGRDADLSQWLKENKKNPVINTRDERVAGLEWAWAFTSLPQKTKLLNAVKQLDPRAHDALLSVPPLLPGAQENQEELKA